MGTHTPSSMLAGLLLATLAVAGAYTPGTKAVVPPRPQHCDVVAAGGICLANGEKILLPDAVPKSMVGRWTFDDNKALDSSGKRNHAKNSIPSGPGVSSRGNSARFNGFDLVEVPHHDSMNAQTFSMSFWFYLIKDPQYNTRWRSNEKDWVSIVQKGKNDNQRSPAFYIEPRIRQIKVAVSTTDPDSDTEGGMVLSNARVQFERWTHLSVVRKGKSIQLYVNGILDGQNVTSGTTEINKGALYIGNTPWQVDSGTFPMYVDEVKMFARALSSDEIEAEASIALGGVEPAFARLGCSSCSFEEALKSCPEDYHLCSAMELHIGGYQTARIMGWGEWSSHIWSRGVRETAEQKEESLKVNATAQLENQKKGIRAEEVGLAVCCVNMK